jgi:LysM repeat protein
LQHVAAVRPVLLGELKGKVALNNPLPAKPVPDQSQFTGNNIPADNTAVNKDKSFTTHLVASKETLFSISRKYGIDVNKIRAWNKLDSLTLKVGQPLIIYRNNY